MTKITITDQYGSCTVESVQDNMDVSQVMADLVIPCMLGRGYAMESIQDVMEDLGYRPPPTGAEGNSPF